MKNALGDIMSSPEPSKTNPMRPQRASVPMPSSKASRPALNQQGSGQTQIDGTPTTQFAPPQKNAPMKTREAAPTRPNQSGMETAMGAMADKMHPPKARK